MSRTCDPSASQRNACPVSNAGVVAILLTALSMLGPGAALGGVAGTYDLVLLSPPIFVSEGAGNLNVNVEMQGVICPDAFGGVDWLATVDYTIQADMNDLGTPVPATVGFSNIGLTVGLTIPIFDDVDDEGDEIFELVLTGVTASYFCPSLGGGIDPNLTEYRFQFIITDNDGPTSMFTVAPVAVPETGGPAIFNVTLLDPPPLTATVEVYTQDQSATEGDDYVAVPVTVLNFPQGTTMVPVPVTILDDSDPEGDEDFFLKLQNPTNATLGVTGALATILDNDPHFLSVEDVMVAEGDAGSPNVLIPVELDAPSTGTISVDWSTGDGTATHPEDYSPAGGTVIISPGSTSANIAVPIVGDTEIEGDEFFEVFLFNESGANLTVPMVTVTIVDDDFGGLPELSIDDAQSVTEGDQGTPNSLSFKVRLTDLATLKVPGTVEVDFTTENGTALAGQDYLPQAGTLIFQEGHVEKGITVPILGDTEDEVTENLFVVLSNPVGATISDDRGRGNILDDDETDPTPRASIDDVTIEEGDAEISQATFTITLSRPAQQTSQVSVATSDGSATVGEDYRANNSTVFFGPGEVEKTLVVEIFGDTEFEDDETFFVDLHNPVGMIVEDDRGVGTIVNDDQAPLPELSIADAAGQEGDAGTTDLLFTVQLAPASDSRVTVDFETADGSAMAGSDFEGRDGTLSFEAGETTQTIRVPITGDQTDEDDETFTVRLLDPDGAEIADAEATGTIFDDDDPALPLVSIDDVTVTEGDQGTSTAQFTVRVLQRTKNVVQVDFATADGTALAADNDYAPTTGRLILESGQSQATLEIPILGDLRVEDDEQFTVHLSSPQGAELGRATGVCTIVNDDEGGVLASTVRLLPAEAVTESAGPAVVTAERSGDASGPASAVLVPASGSAQAGQDFQGGAQAVTWAAGESGPKSVRIPIVDDNEAEQDEQFSVALGTVQGASVGAPRQVVVVILDEDTPMRLEAVGEQELTGTVRQEVDLQVRVLRSDGQPVEGALVSWQAEGKAAVAGEGNGRSDAEGLVTQGILLDKTPGAARVTARLAGTESSVAFAIRVQGDLMATVGPGGGDANENGVADTLDQSCSDGEGEISELCDFIYGLDDPNERRQVVEGLTPKGALARNRAALQGPKTQARNVSARLSALRGGANGRTVAQVAMSIRGETLALGPLQAAFSQAAGTAAGDPQKISARVDQALSTARDQLASAGDAEPTGGGALGGAASGDDALDPYDSTESPWGFFFNGRASFGEAPRRGVEPSYDFETDGLTAGFDYRLSSTLVAGAALGYLRSDTDVEAGRGTIDLEGFSLTLYGTYYRQNFYLDGSLTYGVNEYDIERVIDLPRNFRGLRRLVATGSPDSDQLSLDVSAGYDFRLGPALTLSGFVRAGYVRSEIDAYAEQGAQVFDLAYEDQDVESLLGEIGAELTYPISLSWGVLQPLLRVSYLHEFEDSVEIIRARFVSDPAGRVFRIESERPDRGYLNIAAGFTATLQKGWATYFQYDTDLERDDLDIYTLSGGFRFQL